MKPSYWLNSPTSRNGRLGDTGSLEETMRKIWIDQNSGDCEKRIGLTIASWLEEARTLLKLIARICKRSLSDIGISSRPKMIPLLGNQQNKNFDLFYVLWTWVIGFLSFVRNSSYTRTISNIRDILNLDTFVNFFRSLFRASSHRMTEWANRSLYHADERRHSRRTVCVTGGRQKCWVSCQLRLTATLIEFVFNIGGRWWSDLLGLSPKQLKQDSFLTSSKSIVLFNKSLGAGDVSSLEYQWIVS